MSKYASTDITASEALVAKSMEGDPRQAEERVAGVDGLRDAVERPQRRPVAPFAVTVLDVVVDEAEVVPELHRSRPGQRSPVIARDGGVGEQSQEWTHPLPAGRSRSIQGEVVADHLVEAVRGGIAIAHEADDLGLRIGDEIGEVEVGQDGSHRGQCTRNVSAASSLLSRRRRRDGGRVRTGA
jgi:hypothetical protein